MEEKKKKIVNGNIRTEEDKNNESVGVRAELQANQNTNRRKMGKNTNTRS
jgi:hypothetical protein